MEKYEPIHEISDKVIGPLLSGESLDCNLGRLGLSHPMAMPWHKLIILAAKKKNNEKYKCPNYTSTVNKISISVKRLFFFLLNETEKCSH